MSLSNENQLPNTDSRKGRCTRCGFYAIFTVERTIALSEFSAGTRSVRELASVLTCHGCSGSMIVVSHQTWTPAGDGIETYEPIFYFPPPGTRPLDECVPKEIASCHEEGQRCLSIGAYRASVVMFRGALAQFVEANGSEEAKKKSDLYSRLEVMANESTLHPTLVDWAKIIREVGNEGAHSEKYEPVTKDLANSVAELTKQIIFLHYEVPARVDRARP